MIMRVEIRTIREVWNIKAVVYLDDFILLHQDQSHLNEVGKEIAQFLKWLGWTVNLEKSHLTPSRTWKYLGWEWDSTTLSVRLLDERKKKALSLLREAREKIHPNQWITNRALAKLIRVLSAARLKYPLASLYLVKSNQMKTRSMVGAERPA
jgi:hypothetical protein